MNKIKKLEGRTNGQYEVQEKWIKNLTDEEISKEVYGILALGPKFSINIAPNELNMFDLLADLERIIQRKPRENQDLI